MGSVHNCSAISEGGVLFQLIFLQFHLIVSAAGNWKLIQRCKAFPVWMWCWTKWSYRKINWYSEQVLHLLELQLHTLQLINHPTHVFSSYFIYFFKFTGKNISTSKTNEIEVKRKTMSAVCPPRLYGACFRCSEEHILMSSSNFMIHLEE